MRHSDSHISDEELLRFSDGELSSRRGSKVNAHLALCSLCRNRVQALETVLSEFIEFQHGRRLSNADGPAALLSARLAASEHARPTPGMLVAWAALLALILAGALFVSKRAAVVEASTVPRTDLTPGATTTVTTRQVCQGGSSQSRQGVPVALQQAVFKEYGIRNPRPSAYEVDYLITPELGGASEIRNLWPEPYFTRRWNARVKDLLEDRLHEMVCSGQLDLATAQHELSADWIGAYKKYFHSERPLLLQR